MAWLAFELLQTQLLGEMYSTKMSQGERINFILTYANVLGTDLHSVMVKKSRSSWPATRTLSVIPWFCS